MANERAKGALTAQMFGARLGTNMDIRMRYTPAHINASGKKVNARLSAPFILNLRGKDGGVRYPIIVWGKLGDMFAKNWNEGKEMHFPQLEHNPYLDNIYSRVDRTIVMDKDGQAAKSMSDSWILRDFRWGNESQKTLQREIAGEGCSDGSGRRPAEWNNAQHPDNAAWKAILEMRKNTYFSPQHLLAGVFGFADVVMPRGGGMILFGAQYEREPVVYQGIAPAPVDPSYNPVRTRVILAVATGAPAPVPGAAHVAHPNVPLVAQVHTALTPGVVPTNCLKCQTPLAPGAAFCAGCGTPTAVAVAPIPAMPAGQPVYQAPPVVGAAAQPGAPVPFVG
jgi:hypothetical protein